MNADHEDINHSDTSALDEFATYLATESWRTQPQYVIEATYENRHKVPDVDSISLEVTSTAFVDTLISYGLASDSGEALIFLTLEEGVIGLYRAQCLLPSSYLEFNSDYKVLKKGWHHEAMLNSVAWLCRPCHSAVHGVATNEHLARHFHTVALLLEREDIQR